MATFCRCYKMAVFGVKYRLGLISPRWSEQLYSVIGQCLKDCGHTPLKIGGFKDHVHVLYHENNNGKNNADTWEWVKSHSSKWVNKNRLCEGRFGWQIGYAVFSYSHSDVDKVANYIANQYAHHTQMSYRDEMALMLKRLNIQFEDKDLPQDLE